MAAEVFPGERHEHWPFSFPPRRSPRMNTKVIAQPPTASAVYDQSQEPIVITKYTTDRLLALDAPSDPMALYWFYYNVAKWQHSYTPHATNTYVMKGLRWTLPRLMRAKHDLVNLKLIEQLPRAWNPATRKLGCPCVRVNFILWDKGNTPHSVHGTKLYSVRNNPLQIDTTVRVNRNTTSNVKAPLPPTRKFNPLILPQGKPFNDAGVRSSWAEFVEHRKAIKARVTEGAWKRLTAKMARHTAAEVITALDRTIESGKWTGVFYAEDTDARPAGQSPARTITRGASRQGLALRAMQRAGGHRPTAVLNPRTVKQEAALGTFLDRALGAGKWSREDLVGVVREARAWWEALPDSPYTRPGAAKVNRFHEQMPWASMWSAWLDILREQQARDFRVRCVQDLAVGGVRWRDLVRHVEHVVGRSVRDGRELERQHGDGE